MITSDDYLERTEGDSTDGSYLNVVTRKGTFSFGPFGEGEDVYLPYYRIMASEGEAELEDCTGMTVFISLEDLERITVGVRTGSFWEGSL